mmetsp:Transcript_67291/g.162765  ORF Transcript_67291/g.162765 Transcript_67291/m.162765 type:complete len:279 (-) Transcript_67291:19-855(-)
MGLLFSGIVGKEGLEEPRFQVVMARDDFEIRRYPPAVVARVRYADVGWRKGGAGISKKQAANAAFRILARYIGVFSAPENVAPVDALPAVTHAQALAGEAAAPAPQAMAMTAPVMVEASSRGAAAGPAPRAMAMTAPVLVEAEGDGGDDDNSESMHFFLPASITLALAPRPLDARVRVEELPERVVAVETFTWGADMETMEADRAHALADKLTTLRLPAHGVGVGAAAEQVEGAVLAPLHGDDGGIQWGLNVYNGPFTLPFCRRNEITLRVTSVAPTE